MNSYTFYFMMIASVTLVFDANAQSGSGSGSSKKIDTLFVSITYTVPFSTESFANISEKSFEEVFKSNARIPQTVSFVNNSTQAHEHPENAYKLFYYFMVHKSELRFVSLEKAKKWCAGIEQDLGMTITTLNMDVVKIIADYSKFVIFCEVNGERGFIELPKDWLTQ